MPVAGRVSILIPSRTERFLVPTVQDLLAKARGDIEIWAVLEGYWEHALPADPRLRILHTGTARGMRPAINAAARIATGQYLLKADAHTLWAEGYDLQLKADYLEDNWLLTCRRYALDPENWCIEARTDDKYPIDYHYLSYPYERPGDKSCGLHGTAWRQRREDRKHLELDEEMSSQGSMWFMSVNHWLRLGEMESAKYGNFVNEMQEIGLKTWLSGGAQMVTKRTWYAHLYKGRRYGRMYVLPEGWAQQGFCTPYWMGDHYEKAVRPLRWLIEKFSPVPTWPADLDAAFAQRAA